MENKNINITGAGYETGAIAKTFIANVFSYMGAALAITAVISYWFGLNESLMSYLINYELGKPTTLGWVVMFAPLGFVLLMSFGFNKLSASALLVLFVTYAAVMGLSLSFIFMTYTSGSIFTTFGVTAGMFGFMAILGYTTQTDLTKFGSILMMGVVGIVIASVVNWFVESAIMDYIISFLGVLIFTGLTAYDVQKLKRIGSGVELGSESANKLSVMGALTLYLDFINLFLFLLRFLGNRK